MTAERENQDLLRRLSHLHAADAGEASGAPDTRDAPRGGASGGSHGSHELLLGRLREVHHDGETNR